MTIVWKLSPDPDPSRIEQAAARLRAGRLVAFPTETVYGLGASALDATAVAAIFAAKGRPSTNPLIVHVAAIEDIPQVASAWPEVAERLARAFWPGPLTLVLPKQPRVPDIVTAGGPTVAVRIPAHPIARALIRAAGVPLAAPSANRSMEISPTTAEHVRKSLEGRIDLILDGGPCTGGIESTVVDVTSDTPRVLRFGLISVPMLESICGRVQVSVRGEPGEHGDSSPARSPGQMLRHYSPRTPVRLIESSQWQDTMSTSEVHFLSMRDVSPLCDPLEYAARIYMTLHERDELQARELVIELPPDTPDWAAVRDRLLRAAARD